MKLIYYLLNRTEYPHYTDSVKQALSDELEAWGYRVGVSRHDEADSDMLLLEESEMYPNETGCTVIVIAEHSVISDQYVFISANDYWSVIHPIQAVVVPDVPSNFKYRSFRYWFSPMCYLHLGDSPYAPLVHYLLALCPFSAHLGTKRRIIADELL